MFSLKEKLFYLQSPPHQLEGLAAANPQIKIYPIVALPDVIPHLNNIPPAPVRTVYCDWDGVVASPRRIDPNNFQALLEIARWSNFFCIWSSRIIIDEESFGWGRILSKIFGPPSEPFPAFPFFTNEALRYLFNQLKSPNSPNCPDIHFMISLAKIIGNRRNPFIEQALKVLRETRLLVVIGSSLFDRRRIAEIGATMQQEQETFGEAPVAQLYYFDTQRCIY